MLQSNGYVCLKVHLCRLLSSLHYCTLFLCLILSLTVDCDQLYVWIVCISTDMTCSVLSLRLLVLTSACSLSLCCIITLFLGLFRCVHSFSSGRQQSAAQWALVALRGFSHPPLFHFKAGRLSPFLMSPSVLPLHFKLISTFPCSTDGVLVVSSVFHWSKWSVQNISSMSVMFHKWKMSSFLLGLHD